MAAIAIFTGSLDGGGAERISLFMTKALADAGHRVNLLVQRSGGALANDPIVRRHGIDLQAPHKFSTKGLLRYVRRARPDLVVAMARDAKLVTRMASQVEPGLPFVIGVRGNLERPRAQRFWPRMLGHAPERWLYRRSLGALVPAQAMKPHVQTYFGIDRHAIDVIPNPVLLDRDGGDIDPAHEHWFDRPVNINAGRLTPQKNQRDLIAAFARAGLVGSSRLLILGEGERHAPLLRQAQKLGIDHAVIFGGFVPNIRPYLARARGLVLSSRHEGLPNALIDALASYLPIAAYDCPTGPDELLNHGALGRLVPLNGVDALAVAMRDIASGQLVAAPRIAVDAHLARYRPEHVAQLYVSTTAKWVRRAEQRARLSSSPYRPAYSHRSTAS